MNIFNFFNRKKDEARQSDKIGTSEDQNCPGVCDTPLDSQYTPDRINTLGKRDIFVFGSNLAGRHGGGAARIALNRFGAIYGQGEGLQGNSYAIPTLHFVFDTGAADVTMPLVEATFMLKNDYLKPDDFIGSARYIDANGDISEGAVVNLRHVNLGGVELPNVRASVVKNQKAPLLLGQSVLGRLGSIEIDNNKSVLRITGVK